MLMQMNLTTFKTLGKLMCGVQGCFFTFLFVENFIHFVNYYIIFSEILFSIALTGKKKMTPGILIWRYSLCHP